MGVLERRKLYSGETGPIVSCVHVKVYRFLWLPFAIFYLTGYLDWPPLRKLERAYMCTSFPTVWRYVDIIGGLYGILRTAYSDVSFFELFTKFRYMLMIFPCVYATARCIP